MIFDSLNHAPVYLPLGTQFKTAFDYLATFDPATPDGRYELDGDNLYALAQSYETKAPEARLFESHRRYADIQYVVSGQEVLLYRPSEAMKPKIPYDANKDATLYDESESGKPVYLQPGDFVVLWPQDGHKPGCVWDAPGLVRKVVIKLRLPS